jgi:DNA-binding response OmpR family regulator
MDAARRALVVEAAVPVVIVSAAPDALPSGYRALTAAILTKPLSPAELIATVASVLAGARQGTA